MWKQTHIQEILLLLGFLIAAFAIGFSSTFLNKNQSRTTAARADSVCKCTDDNVCYPDGCSRKPKTSNNTFSEDRYDSVCKQFDPGYRMPDSLIQHFCSVRQPDCCFDIYRYKDSRLCCFQERWTCHPSLCKGSSGGDGCGKYWGLPGGWDAYGCVKKGPDGDKIPYWGLPPGLPNGTVPTSTPTNNPTSQPPTATPTTGSNNTNPTATNTPQPTGNNGGNNSGVTNYPIVPPTVTPTRVVSQNGSNSLNLPTSAPTTSNGNNNDDVALPNIDIPDIAFKPPNQVLKDTVTTQNIEKLNQVTDPPLNVAQNTFIAIKTYDQQIENSVESWIDYIRRKISEIIQ